MDMFKYVDRKNPPPRGGFLFTMFPHQEPCVRGPPSKDLYQVLRGGSSHTRFLIREHSKQETPPGEGVSFDQCTGQNSQVGCSRICIYIRINTQDVRDYTHIRSHIRMSGSLNMCTVECICRMFENIYMYIHIRIHIYIYEFILGCQRIYMYRTSYGRQAYIHIRIHIRMSDNMYMYDFILGCQRIYIYMTSYGMQACISESIPEGIHI